jgi:hypothetical protein
LALHFILTVIRDLAKAAQSAMGITRGHVKECVKNMGQGRVADIAEVPGHSSWLYTARKAIADDQIVTARKRSINGPKSVK